MSCILTLALDEVAQSHFEALRLQHFPPALNRVPAHVSLFHSLPEDEATLAELRRTAAGEQPFEVAIEEIRSIGRGVAYFMRSVELSALHRRLSDAFAEHLTSQDRQGFRPHIVVQNKVDPQTARDTLASLRSGFAPSTAQGVGLNVWRYLNGPWQLIEFLPF